VQDLLSRADAVIDNWFGRKQYLDALRRLMTDLGTNLFFKVPVSFACRSCSSHRTSDKG
jgi:hypothetical protein